AASHGRFIYHKRSSATIIYTYACPTIPLIPSIPPCLPYAKVIKKNGKRGHMQERWTEIQEIWKSNQVLYVIAGFLAGILFFPAIEALSSDASQLFSGFVPEAV